MKYLESIRLNYKEKFKCLLLNYSCDTCYYGTVPKSMKKVDCLRHLKSISKEEIIEFQKQECICSKWKDNITCESLLNKNSITNDWRKNDFI